MNIGRGAYAGGESWRTGPDQLVLNPSSGAYSANLKILTMAQLLEGAARCEAVVEFMRSPGIDVTAIPFGLR
jgi:hypothetical protein